MRCADHRRRDNKTTARRSVSCSPTAARYTRCIKGRGTLVHKHEHLARGLQTERLGIHQKHETEEDTEAGMLSGVSRKRSIRSNPCWFTEFCKSQCLSHFAAPFIVVRAETSVAESCENALNSLTMNAKEKIQRHKVWSKTVTAGQERIRNPNLAYRPRDPTREINPKCDLTFGDSSEVKRCV